MPALNFQRQFATAVESGEKRQTIRAYRKGGRDPKPGDTLYLYTGMRTKQCRRLCVVRCLSADPVRIDALGYDRLPHSLHGDRREGPSPDSFARRDGFANFAEMRDWFQKTHGLPFSGLRISW